MIVAASWETKRPVNQRTRRADGVGPLLSSFLEAEPYPLDGDFGGARSAYPTFGVPT